MSSDINLDEIEVTDDGYFNCLDDDGCITIQLEIEYVKDIFNVFDKYVRSKEEYTHTFDFYGENQILTLSLSHSDDDTFELNGVLGANFFHDFDINDCNLQLWDQIKKSLLQ